MHCRSVVVPRSHRLHATVTVTVLERPKRGAFAGPRRGRTGVCPRGPACEGRLVPDGRFHVCRTCGARVVRGAAEVGVPAGVIPSVEPGVDPARIRVHALATRADIDGADTITTRCGRTYTWPAAVVIGEPWDTDWRTAGQRGFHSCPDCEAAA